MEELYWLNNPIHQNMIKFDMSDELKENVVTSFDGTIIAVKKDKFDLESEEDLILYKMGYKNSKDTKTKKKRGVYYNFIDSEEEFREIVKLDNQ